MSQCAGCGRVPRWCPCVGWGWSERRAADSDLGARGWWRWLSADHRQGGPAPHPVEREDPVDERTGESYLLMTADRKSALEAEYARHGRDHLLNWTTQSA